MLAVGFDPPACAFACLCSCPHSTNHTALIQRPHKNIRSLFHLNIGCFWGCYLDKQRSCLNCLKFLIESVLVLILHAICSAGAQMSPIYSPLSELCETSALPSSSFVISLHGGHCSVPSETETGKSLFSQHWWTGYYSSALYSKNRVLFSQCLHHPCYNLLAKKRCFFYWFGRPGVFFFFVWMCIYYWTKWVHFCVLVLFKCMSFYVWMVRCTLQAALLQHKSTGCYTSVCLLHVLMKTFLTSSQ